MSEPGRLLPELTAHGRGALLENLVAFGRVLRDAGLTVTTTQIEDVARALAALGVQDRERTFRVCRALLVKRKDDLGLFERLFRWFWRDPLDLAGAGPRRIPEAPRRKATGQFTIATYGAFKAGEGHEELDVTDRSETYSDEELLWSRRFADMSEEELAAVRRLLRDMEWSASLRRTRRYVPDRRGPSIDLRRVLREVGRLGSVPARLPKRRRAVKKRPVILLADISGSMEKYSRLVLQFFHAMVSSMPNVETFVFGTRLSRITPELRLRNMDRALEDAARGVVDWSGGTRIGASLATFNREWSRRLLRRGAVVVIVSDGCDGEGGEALAREMRYLHLRCHRLIWLNPFSGHERYAPRVSGMAAALPFVDHFLPLHNVRALHDFSELLARIPSAGRTVPKRQLARPEEGAAPSAGEAIIGTAQ